MTILISRKKGEAINIGGNVEVTVEKIRESTVRLSVVAPKEVKIVRGELKENDIQKKKEKKKKEE